MPRGKRTVNKSAFVRGLPDTTPAAEVVAKAKAQGIVLSDKYVYNIRAKAKSRGGKPVGKPGRKPGRPKGSGAGRTGGAVGEQFVELAMQLGLDRAEALLARLRGAIRSAVRG
jgi:hypothetical protein